MRRWTQRNWSQKATKATKTAGRGSTNLLHPHRTEECDLRTRVISREYVFAGERQSLVTSDPTIEGQFSQKR